MPIVVLKFGGQTLNTPTKMVEALDYVQQLVSQGLKLIVVVSAFGRKGEPYATDTLIELIEEAGCQADGHDLDIAMACGELIAMAVVAQQLRKQGINAVGRTGWEAGIITDGEHRNARIIAVDPSRLLHDVAQHEVVVVAGFQGMDQNGTIHCLGRGGSDTSAVALALAVNADRVELLKDVEGIFTANPQLVRTAQLLDRVSAADLKEMAWQGSKVLHERAAELAERFAVPIVVRSLHHPIGTTIVPSKCLENPQVITGISVHAPICQVQIELPEVQSQEQMVKLFEAVAAATISMDMFSIMQTKLWFTVAADASLRTREVLTALPVNFTIVEDRAKVSIIGAGMHGIPGIMATFCRILFNADVPIIQTADSHATISALIASCDAERAAAALHHYFLESQS